jgi:hypothetical protein
VSNEHVGTDGQGARRTLVFEGIEGLVSRLKPWDGAISAGKLKTTGFWHVRVTGWCREAGEVGDGGGGLGGAAATIQLQN